MSAEISQRHNVCVVDDFGHRINQERIIDYRDAHGGIERESGRVSGSCGGCKGVHY